MDEGDIVLRVECSEPGGKVVRAVKLAELSFDKLKMFWEKTKDFDVLFNDFTKGDFRAFMNHFVVTVNGQPTPAGLIWEVDDVGLFVLNDIKPCESAQVHFAFWDRRYRGREELCREMLKYVFEEYKFRRITAEIPLYAHFSMVTADRIGFVQEGRKRKASLYKKEWYDVNIYSMLPEDLEKPRNTAFTPPTKYTCFKCGEELERKRTYKPRENAHVNGS